MFITAIHSRFEKKLEAKMLKAIHHYMRLSVDDYSQRKRKNWVKEHPEQIVLAVNQIMSTKEVEEAIIEGSLEAYIKKHIMKEI